MKIIPQGQEVITKSGKVRAVVTGACMRGGNVSYEISYFSNNSYHQCWVYAFEFDIDEAEKQQAGFNYPSNQLKISEGK
nr:hypothetical protein [uncultured Flavobacterium sp.]